MDEPFRPFDSLNEWQIEEIQKGITEANRGDFASAEEMRQSLQRWTHRLHSVCASPLILCRPQFFHTAVASKPLQNTASDNVAKSQPFSP